MVSADYVSHKSGSEFLEELMRNRNINKAALLFKIRELIRSCIRNHENKTYKWVVDYERFKGPKQ